MSAPPSDPRRSVLNDQYGRWHEPPKSEAPQPGGAGRAKAPVPPPTASDTPAGSYPFRWSWLGVGLIVVGAFAGTPGLLLVGALLILSNVVRSLWSQRGLRGLTYERHLVNDRAALGEPVELTVSAWNDKLLPLAWLEADDLVTDGLTIRERAAVRSDRPGFESMKSTWTLAPYERVTRHLHVAADRRGVYRFGPVKLQVADLFGRDVATRTDDLSDALLVRPRSVPVTMTTPQLAPLGEQRARFGLHYDPTLFAGVRPYQPTDPRRSVHWRATARLGQPVSKRFEPATSRRTLVALDVQTNEEPYWMMVYDDDLLESLVVATASLVRFFLDDGGAVGLASNAWSGTLTRTAFIPSAAGQNQLPSILDALARLSVFASSPFETVLADLTSRLTPGTAIVVVSGHDPRAAIDVERRLQGSGYPVTHILLGRDGKPTDTWAATLRRAGIDVRTANLPGGWRDSLTLELAA